MDIVFHKECARHAEGDIALEEEMFQQKAVMADDGGTDSAVDSLSGVKVGHDDREGGLSFDDQVVPVAMEPDDGDGQCLSSVSTTGVPDSGDNSVRSDDLTTSEEKVISGDVSGHGDADDAYDDDNADVQEMVVSVDDEISESEISEQSGVLTETVVREFDLGPAYVFDESFPALPQIPADAAQAFDQSCDADEIFHTEIPLFPEFEVTEMKTPVSGDPTAAGPNQSLSLEFLSDNFDFSAEEPQENLFLWQWHDNF